jgi:hypothetical protein
MPAAPHIDAFGRLLTAPDKLPRDARIGVVRALAGRLLADVAIDARWLGGALSSWLQEGGDLAAHLGLNTPRGSHRTAQALVRRDQQDRALARLVIAAGSIVAASAALRGGPCPDRARDALAECVELRCPRSRSAIGIAVARHRQSQAAL